MIEHRYRIRAALLAIALAIACAGGTAGDGGDAPVEPTRGPVIRDFGPVYDVPGAVRLGDPSDGLSVVFDVTSVGKDERRPSPAIESAARFLNMHVRAGYPREKLRVAVVLHGAATSRALTEAAHRERYRRGNPDLELLRALRSAGVDLYVCGQSAAHAGYAKSEIDGSVEVALSAMTVLAHFQGDGYAVLSP